jgi:hypothetical protein
MRVSQVLVRFYKAFNFDYLRKFHDKASAQPWEEMPDGSWYPYVVVDLADRITTVVGANESGKTQILHALESALTGKPVKRLDFCRYSKFFVVDGVMRLPDFGVTLTGLNGTEEQAIAKVAGVEVGDMPNSFTLIRGGDGVTTLWVHIGTSWVSAKLTANQLKAIDGLLPKPFWMDSELPLPDAVPLAYLADPAGAKDAAALLNRKARSQVVGKILGLGLGLFDTKETVTQSAQQISGALGAVDAPVKPVAAESLTLASDLILRIAGVGRDNFKDLIDAVANGDDGYVNGIENKINDALALRLNFRRWWTQDSSFRLRVQIRESDLAFIISDRTGTDYSFGERSNGLKYWLSYFVQYLRHPEPPSGTEILLMDEPDAFLSSEGQRDLLRIFDALAYPEDGRQPCPVVYVTHSPFLMDRNHAERIRVLEKGEGLEGTRVVGDASQNHYEPLRSAFGGFVAETTFMGSCNLMLEGPADQILLAGLSTWLRREGAPVTEQLDLNLVTLVPAGGASHIPYLVYLARGRDVEKPAVIVLLDGDSAGDDARKAIRRGGAYRKQLVDDELVAQLTDKQFNFTTARPDGVADVEDLLPLDIGIAAAQRYAKEFIEPNANLSAIDPAKVDATNGVLKGIEAAMRTTLDDQNIHLDKIGFARAVLEVLANPNTADPTIQETSIAMIKSNFQSLFQVLSKMQRTAMAEHAEVKIGERVARTVESFVADHPTGATRANVLILLEEIDHVLDHTTLEAEDLRSRMRWITDEHELQVDSADSVIDFPGLVEALQALPTLGRHNAQVAAGEAVPITSPAQPVAAMPSNDNTTGEQASGDGSSQDDVETEQPSGRGDTSSS